MTQTRATNSKGPGTPAVLQPTGYKGNSMIRFFSTLAFATLMSASAFAAGATCSTADKAKFKPEAELTAMLTKEGMKVSKIKTEKGCYEVYATNKTGKKMNLAFNAETLAKVANAEAGEQ
jgi:hypothetical protein